MVDSHAPPPHAVEVLTKLLDVDISSMSLSELDAVVADRRVVAGALDAIDVAVARRTRQLREASPGGRGRRPADVLGDDGRRSAKESKAAEARGDACDRLESFEEALAAASVSSGHVDGLASALRSLDDAGKDELAEHEQSLLDQAEQTSVEDFTRSVRNLARDINARRRDDDGADELERKRQRNKVRTWTDWETGMGRVNAELDPESFARFTAALRDKTAALRREQDGMPEADRWSYDRTQAEALVQLATASTNGNGGGEKRRAEVIVLIDLETLIDGLHANSVSETVDGVQLPPSTIRRLACEADIIPVVFGADGVPLDVGRSQRLANAGQRRAIYATHSTCVVPGCQVPVDRCEIHHVPEWMRGGRTDLGKLAPVCCAHHHDIHDGGWQLVLHPDRSVEVITPDGQHRRSQPNRRTRTAA